MGFNNQTIFPVQTAVSCIIRSLTEGTIATRATEVTALQIKKSVNDGDDGWNIANDWIDSIISNGCKVVLPAFSNVFTTRATYIATDLMKYKSVPTTDGKVLPYVFVLYA